MNKSLYIGRTSNLRVRFKKHNEGAVFSTKRYMPWELVYYEAYKAYEDAAEREKQLKRFAKGFGSLKRRLRFSLLAEE